MKIFVIFVFVTLVACSINAFPIDIKTRDNEVVEDNKTADEVINEEDLDDDKKVYDETLLDRIKSIFSTASKGVDQMSSVGMVL